MGESTLRWPTDKEREEKEEVCQVCQDNQNDVCILLCVFQNDEYKNVCNFCAFDKNSINYYLETHKVILFGSPLENFYKGA